MKAVHFGAGNIGRGFVGFLLNRAGYELVFADVSAVLIDALAASTSYRVHEVGENSASHEISNYRALNSATNTQQVVAEITSADIVTTAVGPNVLKFIAPLIVSGLQARPVDAPRLQVMACENAINATDVLAAEVKSLVSASEWHELSAKTIFANTAVDRIVPNQDSAAGLDVTVETFYEWVIEGTAFGDERPDIPGVTWVDDLAPYIERKLFTVNTGHATTAYLGLVSGHNGISESLADPEVRNSVLAVLRETKELLVRVHGFDPEVQEVYLQKILKRFANPYLTDSVQRVGRQPLRKLSRHERFIEPAAKLAELGVKPTALLGAIEALLAFDVPEDPQSVELQQLLAARKPSEFVREVTGLDTDEPLYDTLVEVVSAAQKR